MVMRFVPSVCTFGSSIHPGSVILHLHHVARKSAPNELAQFSEQNPSSTALRSGPQRPGHIDPNNVNMMDGT